MRAARLVPSSTLDGKEESGLIDFLELHRDTDATLLAVSLPGLYLCSYLLLMRLSPTYLNATSNFALEC